MGWLALLGFACGCVNVGYVYLCSKINIYIVDAVDEWIVATVIKKANIIKFTMYII